MVFNYSKLLGRIKECGYTQETLANRVKMGSATMSNKLNNKAHFKQRDILDICDVLEIPFYSIGEYFFYNKSSENGTKNDRP